MLTTAKIQYNTFTAYLQAHLRIHSSLVLMRLPLLKSGHTVERRKVIFCGFVSLLLVRFLSELIAVD